MFDESGGKREFLKGVDWVKFTNQSARILSTPLFLYARSLAFVPKHIRFDSLVEVCNGG